MKLEDLYDTAGHLFRRASQINTALFMNVCAEFELTPVQYIALTAIVEVPGVDVTRLSGLIAFDRSTLGGVVERMEAKGLIVRAADKVDRRVKLLYATPSGVAMLEQMHEKASRVTEELLKSLPAADRKTLMRLMKTIVESNSENLPASVRETADAQADTKPVARAARIRRAA